MYRLLRRTTSQITADIVQSELARITRSDWRWEALPHGADSFLVAFPSDEALQSMVDIGYHLKNHGVTLTVFVWQHNHDIIPTYEPEEVWVHITRVPHVYRNYLVFWALGTVIGTTREVDMYTYRKMGIIRVKVGILDKSQLPLTTDLVFGTEGYHITYTLEDDSFEPVVAPAEDVDHMDQDDFGAGNGGSEDSDRETAAKKMKSDSKTGTSPPQAGNTGPTPMQHFIAVTPLGKNRPYPGFKPIVLMNGTDKLPHIAVTKPKMGFASDLGRTTSKYHPFFPLQFW